MNNETAFNMASSNIRYGPGTSLEIGMDLADMGAENVMVVTDPNLAKLDFVSAILDALQSQSVRYTLFDLVEGTLPQHRVTKLSPKPAGPEELSRLFADAMVYW